MSTYGDVLELLEQVMETIITYIPGQAEVVRQRFKELRQRLDAPGRRTSKLLEANMIQASVAKLKAIEQMLANGLELFQLNELVARLTFLADTASQELSRSSKLPRLRPEDVKVKEPDQEKINSLWDQVTELFKSRFNILALIIDALLNLRGRADMKQHVTAQLILDLRELGIKLTEQQQEEIAALMEQHLPEQDELEQHPERVPEFIARFGEVLVPALTALIVKNHAHISAGDVTKRITKTLKEQLAPIYELADHIAALKNNEIAFDHHANQLQTLLFGKAHTPAGLAEAIVTMNTQLEHVVDNLAALTTHYKPGFKPVPGTAAEQAVHLMSAYVIGAKRRAEDDEAGLAPRPGNVLPLRPRGPGGIPVKG